MLLALLIPVAVFAVALALLPVLFVIVRDERERRAHATRPAPLPAARLVRDASGDELAA